MAEAIAGICRTALSPGSALRALEVNPLRVNGDRVEALDVLVITAQALLPPSYRLRTEHDP
ncbi:MAG TPA: hypothetical protein VFO01_02055 [Trebonia sp.]|nr:hypothetical protein [Trebonia sp.]